MTNNVCTTTYFIGIEFCRQNYTGILAKLICPFKSADSDATTAADSPNDANENPDSETEVSLKNVSFDDRVIRVEYNVDFPANNNGHNEVRYDSLKKSVPNIQPKKKPFIYDASDILNHLGRGL